MAVRLPAAAAALVCVVGLAACTGDTGRAAGLRVVASTTQVADLVREVGGPRVDMHQILRPNSDPHDYEPRPSDAEQIARAKLVFQSGGELDQWLGGVISDAGGRARVVRLTDSVRTIGRDPHWWEDPRDAELAVSAISRALTAADPRGRLLYERRTRAYEARLRRLDRGIAACMAKVPEARRKLVTTHDAFAYFARRYRVAIVGALIPSLSSEAQPSARDTERLVRQVRREGVKAIFPESALNPKLERAVSRETGARVGGTLWADSLGPRGSSGATYLTAMASNTETMVDGMTGGAIACRPRP
ncbi:MAG TPA: zinc ABC transporter substrate-binding protein [Thermoleophilaceae bacterium]|jgi:ABC-type Zn uptake system ZnuABC Zn-binding protein ZnuA|nr:zinc ABC transporter substrate-binding protein [Thermoleophilaceae bacterium]